MEEEKKLPCVRAVSLIHSAARQQQDPRRARRVVKSIQRGTNSISFSYLEQKGKAAAAPAAAWYDANCLLCGGGDVMETS